METSDPLIAPESVDLHDWVTDHMAIGTTRVVRQGAKTWMVYRELQDTIHVWESSFSVQQHRR